MSDQEHPARAALRRVPTQARARQKVDRALDAAESLLEREGVRAITLPRVAEEANISVGALYQYLPDRDAIVAALSATYYARLESLMDTLVAELSSTRPPDPVGAVVSAFARFYRTQAGTRATRAMLQGSGQLTLAREHKLRMVGKVQTLLIALGMIAPDDPETVAHTAFFAADAIIHEAFADDDDGDPALLGELTAMLRAYLEERVVAGSGN